MCVGLDPDPGQFAAPTSPADRTPLLAFDRRIVDATCDLAAAYKPQIAFYSALGAEDELAATIRYIRERAPHALVILDAKRGDIGNTAEAYAREAFDRYGADAVTVNPYMGEDSVLPFLARPERGAVLAVPHIQSRRAGFPGSAGGRPAALPQGGARAAGALERGIAT